MNLKERINQCFKKTTDHSKLINKKEKETETEKKEKRMQEGDMKNDFDY